jgi:hypothetical protein
MNSEGKEEKRTHERGKGCHELREPSLVHPVSGIKKAARGFPERL